MKIDLTCPVELWQYAMPTDEHSECTFVMNNLSDKVVVSVQVTLNCYDQQDQLLFRQTERVQGLKAGVGERFSIVILPSQWNDVEGMDLVIEKVWFDDATIWRKGNAPLAVYTSNAIPAGRALDELRFVAGKDAVGYPQVQKEAWLCVCGRANALDSDRCCRCERRRDAVLASFNRENVSHVVAAHEQKLAQTARKAREENNILQENQEKKRVQKRRRRKQAVRLALSGLCVAAVAAFAVVWGIPMVRYRSAQDLLRDKRYDEARAAFQNMGDYRDAAQQALECDYQQAWACLNAGHMDSLEKAEAGFAALGDYGDSADQRKEAAYELAQARLDSGEYEAAVEGFQALGEYRDAAEKALSATYQQANALLESGNYTVARVLFAGLGEYQDAAAKMRECGLLQGKALLNNGDYEGAVSELSALPENQEAVTLAQEANYALAEASLAQGDYQTAGEKYLLAGDYSDAQAKANECLYRYAQQRKSDGAYEEAIQAFGQIPAYLDSEGQIQDCVYQQAKGLADAGDYAGALDAFDGVGEAATLSQDAQELAYLCHYQLGMAALNTGDLSGAEKQLENAGDYQDGEKQLRAVRYQLAESLLDQGSYAEALPYYDLLGTYKDSTAKRKRCRYEIAKQALANGDYGTALEELGQLGSYQDSKALLEEAAYQQALALEKDGNGQAALATLDGLNNDRARQAAERSVREQAAALEAEKKYDEAAALDATLTSDEGKQRYNACVYAQATQQKENGNLAEAGELFYRLGDYQDAAAQSQACYADYCGTQAAAAREAMNRQDYLAAITALENLSMDNLTGEYRDLPDLYKEACYQYAEQLYRDGKPYEALPYYQRVGDYRDTLTKKLSRRAYLILGSWTSASGRTAVFREDGTCDLMGEKLYFRVSSFSLYTGETADTMTITHKLSSIDENGMSLRDIRNGGDRVYKFTRSTEETAAPTAAPTPSAAPASEETAALEKTDAQP